MTLFNVLQYTGIAIGLLANAFLFATTPRQRTVSCIFLLQRAVAEVLVCMALVFFLVRSKSSELDLVDIISIFTFTSVVLHVGTVADVVFLMLFSMDSYLASRPQHHTPAYRRKVMWLTSTVTWILAAAFGVATYISSAMGLGSALPNLGPYFIRILFSSVDLERLVVEVLLVLLVPLVVVWVFVGMALQPRPADPNPEEGHKGLNRHLMLGLASTFTVLFGLYYLVIGLAHVQPSVIDTYASLLPLYSLAINPILVFCLTEGMRQKVAGWLPARHSDALPLREL